MIPLIFALVVLGVFFLAAFTGAPYVPSKKSDLKTAFEKLYHLSAKDTLIDLGAGDGAVLKFAAKYGAKTVGVELNPFLAFVAKFRSPSSKIRCKNYNRFSFPPDTTVVYVFADSRDILKIYQKVESEAKKIKKPLFLISLAFPVPGKTPEKSAGPYYLYKA